MGDFDGARTIWSLHETSFHTNCLELMVVKFILVAQLSDIQNQHVRVQSYNTTVVSFIHSMNGSQSAE